MNSENRRRILFGAAGGIAALAGAGIAWRQSQLKALAEADAQLLDYLWGLQFKTVLGQSMSLSVFRGKPLLLNFWATWCPPCVEELPLIDRFYQENMAKGWQVLGLAIDKLDAVEKFLARIPLKFPIAIADQAGADLTRRLGDADGALPFSVLLNSSGAIVRRKLGKLSEVELNQWVLVR